MKRVNPHNGTVWYRIPGEKIHRMEGAWYDYSSDLEGALLNQAGFLMHSFSGEQTWLFKGESIQVGGFNSELEKKVRNTSLNTRSGRSPEEYQKLVEKAIRDIEHTELHKVVLSRFAEVSCPSAPLRIFQALCECYSDAFVYWAQLPNESWLAATPERFIQKEQDQISTYSLAGTLTMDEPDTWDIKTRQEQQIVTDYLVHTWNRLGVRELITNGPRTQPAGGVKHLLTILEGKLDEERALDLFEAMHPTPAVCGEPLQSAKNWIEQNEGYDRSFYTGVVGLISIRHWNLFVNLRCMRMRDDQARLFVGGGLTKDSNPAKEWQETEFKLRTILSVIENL